MMSPIEAREAVHVLLLRELQDVQDARAVVLKGGVNLRLFHGSPRYSEDMDLDGDSDARLAIRSAIRGIYKFHVLAPGSQSYGTKVEISFRGRDEADSFELAEPDPSRVGRYLAADETLMVQRYGRDSAIRQKIEALAGRTRIEARDIFDIHMLLGEEEAPGPALLDFLARNTDPRTLELAYERALELEYPEYESLVVRFLEDEARERYRSRERWDVLRLTTAALLQEVQASQQEAL